MGLTLLDLRNRLRSSIGNLTSTDDAGDALLNQHINSAYEDISNKFRFHKMRKLCDFSTVAGTRRYGIPDGATEVYQVRDLTNNNKLEKLGQRRAEELPIAVDGVVDPVSLRGKPVKYVRTRDFLELHPTPDGTYLIRVFYKAEYTPLVSDADTPVLPDSWHRGIGMLARWYFYDQSGDLAKAEQSLNSFNRWVADQPSEVDEETRQLDSGVEIPTLSRDVGSRYPRRQYAPDRFNREDD